MQVLEELCRRRAEDRDTVWRNVGGCLPSGLLHRRQLILNVRILLLIRLLLSLLLSLLLLSLLRVLLPVCWVSGGGSAVARVAGDRLAVSITWISLGLSVLLPLLIDEGLPVR